MYAIFWRLSHTESHLPAWWCRDRWSFAFMIVANLSHKSLISNFSYFHIRLFHSMHFLFIIKISFMLFSCHEIYDISEVFFPLCFETKMHTEISWERVALYSIKEVFQHRRRNNKTIALSCEAFSYFFISKKKETNELRDAKQLEMLMSYYFLFYCH